MLITLYGIDYETLKQLHTCFHPRTIITSLYFNNDEKLYVLELTSKCKISTDLDMVIITLGKDSFILHKNKFQGVSIT